MSAVLSPKELCKLSWYLHTFFFSERVQYFIPNIRITHVLIFLTAYEIMQTFCLFSVTTTGVLFCRHAESQMIRQKERKSKILHCHILCYLCWCMISCRYLPSKSWIKGFPVNRRMISLLTWSTALIKFVMLMLLSSWVTAQSMAKGFWFTSTAVMGLYRMHYTLMMNLRNNFRGMPASGWHLELQEPWSKWSKI